MVNAIEEKHFRMVENLFRQKEWELPEQGKPSKSKRFNQFCKMLEQMKNEEKEFVIELTRNFIKIEHNAYGDLLKVALRKAFKEPNIISRRSMAFSPLISPDDRRLGKSKSSQYLFYLMKDQDMVEMVNDKGKKELFLDTIQKIKSHRNDSEMCLVLLDDFIGTGETACKAIREMNSCGIGNDKLAIVSLVAHSIGMKKIKESGVPIYSSIEIKKGISDKFSEKERKKKIAKMLKIEEHFGVVRKFSLGYGSSEALVSLINTPNNTFPIYWYGEEEGRSRDSIPFLRQKT
nr:phosphoribosyltransferase [uncultured Anaeromusa sp.]